MCVLKETKCKKYAESDFADFQSDLYYYSVGSICKWAICTPPPAHR